METENQIITKLIGGNHAIKYISLKSITIFKLQTCFSICKQINRIRRESTIFVVFLMRPTLQHI